MGRAVPMDLPRDRRSDVQADLSRRLEDVVERGFGRSLRPPHLARRAVFLLARGLGRAGRPVRVRTRTFWGGQMSVMLPELSVSRTVWLWGLWEPSVTRMLIEVLRPGMVVVDVGAHLGYTTLLAARLVGDDGRVHAFEPAPGAAAVLRRNVVPHPSIEVFDVALSSREGELTLTDFGVRYWAQNTLTPHWRTPRVRGRARPRTIRVPTLPLDLHAARTGIAPDFVKVDVESAEMSVLEGMQEIIARHRPAIAVEVGDEGEATGRVASAVLVRFLLDRGYAAWEVDLGGGRPVPHVARDRYSHGNLLFTRPDWHPSR